MIPQEKGLSTVHFARETLLFFSLSLFRVRLMVRPRSRFSCFIRFHFFARLMSWILLAGFRVRRPLPLGYDRLLDEQDSLRISPLVTRGFLFRNDTRDLLTMCGSQVSFDFRFHKRQLTSGLVFELIIFD